MGRAPCCDKASVKRGPWSPEEDQKLKEYIEKNGTGGNWIALPQKAGLKRCGKSCRLRWLNYLRPDIKHGEFSEEEDRLICSLFANIGSRWSIIAGQLPGRTDNDIKNYWNTKLKKKLMGLVSSSSTSSQKRAFQSPNTYPSYNNSINNNSLFTGYTPISVQTSLKVEEPQPYFGPTQTYNFKENNSVLSFGGGGDQASCSTSSDGSYNNNNNNNNNNQMISHETAADHEAMVSLESNYNSGLFGESQIDYSSLDEIKQLISTSNVSSNLNNFSFDEKVLYY